MSTIVVTTSSPIIPPTPDLFGLPPVVLGFLQNSKKRAKKRLIDGLHLGSLPHAPKIYNSATHFLNETFNPFFSKTRRNMELSHGRIKERFPVRFPDGMQYDAKTGSVSFDNKQH